MTINISDYKLKVIVSCDDTYNFIIKEQDVMPSVICKNDKNLVYRFNDYLYLCEDIITLFRPCYIPTYYMPVCLTDLYSDKKEIEMLIKIFNLQKKMSINKELLDIYERLLNNIIFDV
jgi:hypothetical protein